MADSNETEKFAFSAEEVEQIIKLEAIFMPIARQHRDRFYQRDPITGAVNNSSRFVHYTSAEAGLNIINTKRIWMRNAMSMSDYSEVQHGFQIVQRFVSNAAKWGPFVTATEECAPGAVNEAIELFDQQWNSTRLHTYIASISEHLSEEDQHGRLSMWRAFGGSSTARVALVFKFPWNSGASTALNLLFSPVAYLQETQVHETLQTVITNVQANRDYLRSLDRTLIVKNVFIMLLAAVTCLKHEGFKEEREWRAIYSPFRLPSDLMEHSVRTIAGVPQSIYSIPLDQDKSPCLAGLHFPRIFDRLIIGPSPYSWSLSEAFVNALTATGIPQQEALQRVQISGIPIRT